jgi:nitrogen fixation protein NifU and related proteins
MSNEHIADVSLLEGEGKLLSESGYAPTAIKYYLDKPYMGELPDATQTSEMLGTCGDTMKIFLKIDNDIIADARYQVLGCPGAISAAMAAVDIIKGKSLDFARKMNDGDVFQVLEDLPSKKHHCIQLAVKTLHKAIDEYREGISSQDSEPLTCGRACDCSEDCQKTDVKLG